MRGETREAPGALATAEKRELVSVAQAARQLGKSRDTVYRWMTEGRLEGRKLGDRWWVYADAVEREWEASRTGPGSVSGDL